MIGIRRRGSMAQKLALPKTSGQMVSLLLLPFWDGFIFLCLGEESTCSFRCWRESGFECAMCTSIFGGW